MGGPSFAVQIKLADGRIEKSDAAHLLLVAFEQAGSQEFSAGVVRAPADLAFAEIKMGENAVELSVRGKVAAYEQIASASAKAGGAPWRRMAGRTSMLGKAAMLAAALFGRVDWAAAERRSIKRTGEKLANASLEALRSGINENLRTMTAGLDIHFE